MQTTKSFKYWQWRVIICSMLGYSMFYFVRKNFSFAMPLLSDKYGITEESFGIIITLAGLIYGVSKFINGIIADRTNARWHLVVGLTACVAINVIFGFSDILAGWISGGKEMFLVTMVNVMAVLMILNNIFQGTGFSPCNRLMTHWVPPHELATKMSIWNASHSIGAAVVSVICGYIGDWRLCFWIPAMISAVGVVFIIVTLRDTPKSVGLPELPNTKTEMDEDDSSVEYKTFVKKMVFRNPVVWAVAICDLFIYIVRFAVLDWGPTFLTKGDNPLSPGLAGWTMAIFEISGCLGMLTAGWISDKLFAGRAQRVCAIEMALLAVCMLAIWLLPNDSNPVIMLVLLALGGFLLYGPQALVGVVAANQATKKAASAAVGLVGLCSYASVIFTGAGLGWYSSRYGWDDLFLIMAGAALIGMCIVVPLWNIKKDGYIHEEETK